MVYLAKQDIVDTFRKCGIHPGSVLMLHSDAIFLAQTRPISKEEKYALFFDALEEVLGPEGTLIVPTYTYSATKGEPFIVEETPSTVGDLTEYFRKQPGVIRSKDPIFSVAARGALAEEFANAEVLDAFGSDSVFGLLDRYNAWIACLACSLNRITYTHYVEQIFGVDYRYFKNFRYTIIYGGETKIITGRYFVRDLERKSKTNLFKLGKILIDNNKLIESSVGRFNSRLVSSKCFKQEALNLLSAQQNSLIMEGCANVT